MDKPILSDVRVIRNINPNQTSLIEPMVLEGIIRGDLLVNGARYVVGLTNLPPRGYKDIIVGAVTLKMKSGLQIPLNRELSANEVYYEHQPEKSMGNLNLKIGFYDLAHAYMEKLRQRGINFLYQ